MPELDDAPSHHTATLDGGRVHWIMSGKGEPVLLLHGWPETSHACRRVVPLLAPHHLVIAPNLPGCGDSEPHPDGGRKRASASTGLCSRTGKTTRHGAGRSWPCRCLPSAVPLARAAMWRPPRARSPLTCAAQ